MSFNFVRTDQSPDLNLLFGVLSLFGHSRVAMVPRAPSPRQRSSCTSTRTTNQMSTVPSSIYGRPAPTPRARAHARPGPSESPGPIRIGYNVIIRVISSCLGALCAAHERTGSWWYCDQSDDARHCVGEGGEGRHSAFRGWAGKAAAQVNPRVPRRAAQDALRCRPQVSVVTERLS